MWPAEEIKLQLLDLMESVLQRWLSLARVIITTLGNKLRVLLKKMFLI